MWCFERINLDCRFNCSTAPENRQEKKIDTQVLQRLNGKYLSLKYSIYHNSIMNVLWWPHLTILIFQKYHIHNENTLLICEQSPRWNESSFDLFHIIACATRNHSTFIRWMSIFWLSFCLFFSSHISFVLEKNINVLHHRWTVVKVKNEWTKKYNEKENISVRPTCETITDVPRSAVELNVIYYNGFFAGWISDLNWLSNIFSCSVEWNLMAELPDNGRKSFKRKRAETKRKIFLCCLENPFGRHST